MPAKKKSTPEPVPQFVVCSLCDEPWSAHQEVNGEVSTLECIRLLKAKRYTPTITVQPQIIPWRLYPYQPYAPYYGTTTITYATCGQNINQANTPTIATASAAA